MDMPHLFIHSSINRYFGCLQFLAVIINVAVHINIQFFYVDMFSFLLAMYLGVERHCILQWFFSFYLENGRGAFLGDIVSVLETALIRRQELWVRVSGLSLTGLVLGNSLFHQL